MTATPTDLRRTDLDWLRIGAFGLLILYHVGVFYAPAPTAYGAWSPRRLEWLVAPMLALHPWRLLLLFVISGAATRFMADKMRPWPLFRSRTARLLIPLVFGAAVIVPPQAFVMALERFGYTGGYLEFWGRYLATDDGFCNAQGCLQVPTYAHLWFVAYLWLYTTLLASALAAAPRLFEWLQRGVDRLLMGPGLVLAPAACLVAARFALEPAYPLSGNPAADWYAHAIYLGGFLLGFLMVRSEALWPRIEAMRRWSLAGALACYAGIMAMGVILLGPELAWLQKADAIGAARESLTPRLIGAVVWGFDQWFWILAAFGFARRHLSGRDGPVRRYLTDAVFPFYIIHQTTIEVMGHYLAPSRLWLPLEAALIIGGTAASCWAAYELARRIPLLRPLFGLKAATPRPPARRDRPVRADTC